MTDITEHPTGEGKLYCCLINDLSSNRIVGYSIGPRMTKHLASNAPRAALARRRFVGTVIVHSDRGSQFRSRDFVAVLKAAGLSGSMGRVAAAGNDVAMESFQRAAPEERYADITSKELTERGLYQSLDRRGVTVQVAHQSVTARRATAEEAELLRVHEGDPLLNMKRTAFDASGQPTETGFHSYHPELYSFEVTLVRN